MTKILSRISFVVNCPSLPFTHIQKMNLRHDVQALASAVPNLRRILGGGAVRQRAYQRYLSGDVQSGRRRRSLPPAAHQPLRFSRNPPALMENVRRVTEHIRGKLDFPGDVTRRVLTIIPTRDGQLLHRDEDGQLLADLHVHRERLHVSTPSNRRRRRFRRRRSSGSFRSCWPICPPRGCSTRSPTSTTRRNASPRLEQAIAADAANRAAAAKAEIEFALSRKPMASVLARSACERGNSRADDAQRHEVQQRDARQGHATRASA